MEAKEKKILTYVGIATVLIGGYFFFTSSDGSGTKDDPTGNGDDDAGDVGANFNPTKVANELYEIMGKTIPNKTGVFNELRNVSQSQFGEVINAFGEKKYNNTFGNTLEAFYETLPKKDLIFWLKAELGSDIQTLKLKYPKYL